MNNQHYFDFIRNTNFLQDVTKNTYIKRLDTILADISSFDNIEDLLKHPEVFYQQLLDFSAQNTGRQGNTLGNHTKDAYFSAILALFLYNQELKEKHSDLFIRWCELHKLIRQPLTIKYKSNQPTERQVNAYIPFDEVIKIRDSLPIGSPERLLVMIYTEIPPVRSDFYKTKFITQIPHTFDDDNNFIVLDKDSPILILEKYKTAKKYGVLFIDIPVTLYNEIQYSILSKPREYLFVSNSNKPFEKENTFNKWANNTLKQVFNNKFISISILRHIYISRRDLKLEEKSGLEQDQIAKIMGHSIEQQRKYLWHSWLKNLEQ